VGGVLDESDPLEEHVDRPRLSRLTPATQASGPVEDEWLRDNLVAIAQLAESPDRSSFDLAMRIVPNEWCAAQLPTDLRRRGIERSGADDVARNETVMEATATSRGSGPAVSGSTSVWSNMAA
jgi:hypothetical protein